MRKTYERLLAFPGKRPINLPAAQPSANRHGDPKQRQCDDRRHPQAEQGMMMTATSGKLHNHNISASAISSG